MWKANRSYLGIGGRWGEPGSRIRYTKLRVSRSCASAR
jgi:hypothetical protein